MNDNYSQAQMDLRFFLTLALTLVLFGFGLFFIGRAVEVEELVIVEQSRTPSAFDEVEVVSRAAFVYDSRMGEVLYAKAEDERMPLASLVKVMAALAATELAPVGNTVTITAEALGQVGDTGLYLNERWRLRDILDFSLLASSNDGMKAVAISLGALDKTDPEPGEAVADFVRYMNSLAVRLGLQNTRYYNVTGLDESENNGGGYSTAREQAMLFDYIIRAHPSLLEATKERELVLNSLDGHTHLVKNTGFIVADIPGIKASKTGFTNLAGGNLAVVFDPEVGRPVVVVVLDSTRDGRFEDVLMLMRRAMETLNNNN